MATPKPSPPRFVKHSLALCTLILKMGAAFISETSVHCPQSLSAEATVRTYKLKRVFQISVPLSCLPKYSDNDVPGSTYPQIDSSVPEATKCYHELQFFDEGAQWRSKQDPCTMCNCHQNHVKCDTVPCPQLTCSSRPVPGECCPSCTSELL